MKDDAKRSEPPWIGNEADQARMCDWVIAKLEAMDEEQFDRTIKAAVDPDPNVQAYMRTLVKRQLAELRSEERAIAEADCGNMKPLRKLYPQLERFLQPPKLSKRGQHFKPLGGQWDLQAQIRHARADVRRIRALWKAEYGKSYRPKGQITAANIAAKRWGISVKAIEG